MKVLVTDPIDETGIDRLREAGLEVEERTDITSEALVDAIGDVDALVIRGTEITAEHFAAAPDLRIVARAGIGVDNIDIDAATEHDVIVANAPRGNVMAASEHTVALALSSLGSIPKLHQRLRAGEEPPDPTDLGELSGAAVGIVGLGRVGQRVAELLGAFDTDLHAYDPYLGQDRADQLGIDLVDDVTECVERADVISVNAPITSETDGLLGAEELAHLEDGYLVHTGRGGVVDETALAEAVADGPVAGAAVDVFRPEPPEADNPMLAVEDIVVTPHLGGTTTAAQVNVAETSAEQVVDALAGEPVQNSLNIPWVGEDGPPELREYVGLAEDASRVATRLLDGRVDAIEVTFSGEIAEEEAIELATARAFNPFGWQVPVVDAPARIARRRGIDVGVNRYWQAAGFQSLAAVTARSNGDEVTVSGTIFHDEDPRLVSIDGYRVDASPSGYLMVVRNRDEPGVIGAIGTILGEADVNIAGMANSREPHDGEALTVYTLDDPLPEAARERLTGDERIHSVTTIDLGD